LDPPEPEAKVEYIAAGDIMLNIAAKHYRERDPKYDKLSAEEKRKLGIGGGWGDDARFYVAALAYVNRTYGGIMPRNLTDADFKERANWKQIKVQANHAIWIPKKEYLQPLKGKFVSSGSISYELYTLARGIALKFWEMTVGNVAFGVGLVHGALLSVYDALADIVELAQLVWKILRSLLSGDLIKDAKKLWNTLKGIDWGKAMGAIANDFMAKWNADSTWTRFHFQGKVVGYIIGMIILAVLTAGATAAAAAAGKLGKFAKIVNTIANNPVVKTVMQNATVKKIVDKGQDLLDKSAELKQKLAKWKADRDALLFKGLRLSRGYDARMGIPEEHFNAMVDAARETQVIAMFRANKKAAIPLIRKGAHGKPMWAKFKTDPDTGVLTAKNAGELYATHANGHYTISPDGKSAYRMLPGGARVDMELIQNPFWKVKPGQVLAPDGKPVVGDYDLLGVAPIKSPGSNVNLVPDDLAYGDWNGPWVRKYADAVNKKGRLDEPRVLHGAQDGYGGNPKYMGLTDDTAYAVFPDGRTYVMEGRKAQQKFYDALGRQTAAGQYPKPAPGKPVVDEVGAMRARRRGGR
jgi:hypothetical protein